MITVREFKRIEDLVGLKLVPIIQRLDSLEELKEQVQMNQEIMLQISKKLDVNIAFLQGNVNSNSERLGKVEFQADYLMQRDAELRESGESL